MIEIERISRGFGNVRALDQISLRIETGERVLLVGPSGSGKTTLLRAILGLERVVGSIRLCGEDVAQRPEVALNNICYLAQIAPEFEAPVIELIRAVTLMQALPARVIYEKAKALGLALESCERTRFNELSPGTKKTLLAAIALSAQSPFLLCDEPLADLDAKARAGFLEQLREIPRTRTIIACARRPDELEALTTRTIEFCEGRVVRDEPNPSRATPSLGHPKHCGGLGCVLGAAPILTQTTNPLQA